MGRPCSGVQRGFCKGGVRVDDVNEEAEEEEKKRGGEGSQRAAWESEGRDRPATPLQDSLQGVRFCNLETQLLATITVAIA